MARAAFVLVLVLVLVLPGAFGVAGAQDAPGVVVYPFVTTDEELVIYGKPVADALVRGLAADGVRAVVATGDAGDAGGPSADLAIELRATRVRRKVRIEALVRDAETGQQVGSTSARATPLGDLDVAAADLSKKLARLVSQAGARREERRSRELAETEAPAPAAPRPAPDPRPVVVVYRPDGVVAGGAIPVGDVATGAIVKLLSGLGYRALISSTTGVAPTDVAAASARGANARATLMLYVYGVDYTWDGVLLARGRLRLIAVAPDQRVLVDRVLETDTLVGSRGDRHDALLRFVVRQAMDMSRRELALALR